MSRKEEFQFKLAERYHDMPRPLQKGKYPFILAVIIIPIIHFFIFYVYLNFNSILLAFQETKYVSGVGEVVSYTFDNFKKVYQMLGNGGDKLTIALKNTLELWCVDVLMIIPIFIIAYCFAKNMPGAKLFRIMLHLPTIISSTVYTTIVTSILQPNIGAIAVFARQWFGANLPPLLQSDEHAWKTVIVYCIWSGFYANLLLMEAALRRIPSEVIEAAQIDGAGTWGIIRNITIPMTWPTMSMILLFKVTSLLTISAPILLLTNGQYNTQTLSFWNYEQVAVYGNYHVPAASGLIITFIMTPIVIVFRKLVNKVSDDLEY